MNKLEEIHINSIESVFDDTNSLEMAQKSAKITTDVAIKFSEWYFRETFNTEIDEEYKTTQELFDYFINNVYGK